MEKLKAYLELTKPRLSLLSVFSAMVGYCLALFTSDNSLELFHVGIISIGIGFCAGGAAVINQWMEYPLDNLMKRTKIGPFHQVGLILYHL